MSDWIVVNWDKFQHYRDGARSGSRTTLDLSHNSDYLALTGLQRALLYGLWMIYAASDDSSRSRSTSVNRWLGLRDNSPDFKALEPSRVSSVFAASRPIAPGYPKDRDIKKRT